MNYIFVDCFDTILKRRVSPEEVKIMWAEKVSECIPLSAESMYGLFVAAEQTLIQKNKQNRESEWRLNELFQLIRDRIEIYSLIESIPDAFVSDCITIYENLELSVLYINSKVEKLIRKLKKKQKAKVFLVSDFYCGKDYLEKWVNVLGIGDVFDDYFVSCDYNLTKRNGTLYSYIIHKLGIASKSQITMIGDNKHSDYIVPKKMGINTIRIHQKIIRIEMKKDRDFSNLFEKYSEIYRVDKGFSNYSFELYLFIDKLANSLLNQRIDKVYFLSREGEFLKRLFDVYVEKKNISIKSFYFYASRNSLLLANLKVDDLNTYKFISNEVKNLSIRNFLKTLQFSDEVISLIQKNTRLNFTKVIDNFFESKEITMILKDVEYRADLEKRVKAERIGFLKYLKTIDISDDVQKLCIVDVGWKGTMQDILFDFFEGHKDINGYYIGVKAIANVSIGNVKYGLLFNSIPYKMNSIESIFSYGYWNYEQVLRATHPRVTGYFVDHYTKSLVQFESNDEDVRFYESHIKNLQNSIYEKFIVLCGIEMPDDSDSIISSLYRKMMLNITFKDYLWICDCADKHFDSFGTMGYLGSNRSVFGYIRYMLGIYKHLGFFHITRRNA